MMRRKRALLLTVAVSGFVGCATRGGETDDVDLTGVWTGYLIEESGNRFDLTMRLDQQDEGYAGTLLAKRGGVPEMRLRNIRFFGDSLTFDFAMPAGPHSGLIQAHLLLDNRDLVGSYLDSAGGSARMFFLQSLSNISDAAASFPLSLSTSALWEGSPTQVLYQRGPS